jgi:hypothetical protein
MNVSCTPKGQLVDGRSDPSDLDVCNSLRLLVVDEFDISAVRRPLLSIEMDPKRVRRGRR